MSASGAESMGEVYATALAEAALEKGALEDVGEEMASFAKTWDERRDVRNFFLSGAIQKDAKQKAVEAAFRGKASDLFADFLQVLLHRGRLWLLPDAADAFRKILDRRGNRVPVTITTATPLSADQLQAITLRLRAAIGKEPMVTQEVKPALVGGAILRVGDVVADGSVRKKLSELRSRIVRSVETVVQA
jgi:F-type H+-transporting ATPase subunit delta